MEKRKGFNPLVESLFHYSKFRDGFNNSTNDKDKRDYFLTGYTLIELLVVIVIIAVLLAILIPSLRKVRNQARNVICKSHLKQWGTVFSLYIDDNKGHFFEDIFAPWWLVSSSTPFDKTGRITKQTVIQNLPDFAKCPMAMKTNDDPNSGIYWGVEGTWLHTKADIAGRTGSSFEAWEVSTMRFRETDTSERIKYYGSYGLNIALVHAPFWTTNAKIGKAHWQGLDTYSITRQGNIPVLLDCASPYNSLYSPEQPPAATEAEEIGSCINRHDGGVNSLFLDCSVRKVGLKEQWKLKWHRGFDTNGHWTKAGGVQPEDWPSWMRSFKDY